MKDLMTDNRDMHAMEEYYLARIEVLERRLAELERVGSPVWTEAEVRDRFISRRAILTYDRMDDLP